MIDIRGKIHAHLNSVLDIVLDSNIMLDEHIVLSDIKLYFQAAPDTASFPYLVYDIPTIFDDGEGFQVVSLDLDGWDRPPDGDTKTLETLMSRVNYELNKSTLITESMVIVFYLSNRLMLQEDDPTFKRRKHVYHGRLFERGGIY